MKRREFLQLLGGTAVLAALPAGCTQIRKGPNMAPVKLANLTQPPYNTTLMGVVKGAVDYYGVAASGPTAFGLSGHAFLINIHQELCPSGPYCWNHKPTDPLLRNLGLEVRELGFFSEKSPPEERAAVETKLRAALDARTVCALVNMEHQLITGYDDTGFDTARPWECNTKFPPARLTFGSWQEFGQEIHAGFFSLHHVAPADHRQAVLASLDYAVDLHTNPKPHGWKNYGIGPDAYANWIAAVPKFGDSHGNWWNATVWSECRQMASRFFAEIQQRYPAVAREAGELVAAYAQLGAALARISDKKMPAAEKVRMLGETKEKEAGAVKKVAALAGAMRAGMRG